jgi:hypothetical protein
MMNSSSTAGNPTAEKIAPYALLGMTAVTGLVDAVSFLPRERLHCEHDGEHLDSSVCDGACVWTVPGALVNGAHSVCYGGDTRRTDHGPRERRFTDSVRGTSIPARGDLSLCSVVLQHRIQKRFAGTFFSTACSDRLHGAGHGHAECRCSEARNLGSDDDRPNINGHGHRCGLLTRQRQQPEIGAKSWLSLGNLFRCSARCSRHTLLDLSGAGACDRNLRRVLCCVVSLIAYPRYKIGRIPSHHFIPTDSALIVQVEGESAQTSHNPICTSISG